jgi:amidase
MKTITIALSVVAVAAIVVHAQRQAPRPFTVVEATIPELRAAMAQRRVTSRQIVTEYLTRIATYDDKLHATITVNPKALEEADERDRERAAGRIRGPLHGIPVALKDNIHTTHLPTTGGALAFDGFVPPYEATLTTNLRAAGAIILAKTNMTELANWVAIAMPGNYNAVSGFGFNPYDPRRDPRTGTNGDGRPVLSPGGSSSPIGTAANFWAANVGTETSGSILTPAGAAMLVGIKPTVGRVSRYGVIPITADQDTPGPMTKSVTDAAVMLGALESASPDPNDPATRACTPPPGRDYTKFLKSDGLKGLRIGVPRGNSAPPAATTTAPATTAASATTTTPSPTAAAGRGAAEARAALINDAVAVLAQLGATLLDPADVPSVIDPDRANNFGSWGSCSGNRSENCSIVLQYGMKRDFNHWLQTLGPTAPVKSLTELIQWNVDHKDAGAIKYGQAILEASDQIDLDKDRARYEADRAKDVRLAATHGIDEVLKAESLDALVFSGGGGIVLGAKAGYPSITVPFGLVPANGTFPPGFDPKPQPVGIMFTGTACSEPKLIQIAYAFEQATKRRVKPF